MWPALIIAVVLLAAATASAAVKTYRPRYWPKGWSTPPAALFPAAEMAAKRYSVPAPMLLSLAAVETGRTFRVNPRHPYRPLTWAKIRSRVVPGSSKTWEQLYSPADCRAWGMMGLMPFNLVGVPGGLPPGAPLSAGLNLDVQMRQAARLLKHHYDKTGTWEGAVKSYNPGSASYYGLYVKARQELDDAMKAVV